MEESLALKIEKRLQHKLLNAQKSKKRLDAFHSEKGIKSFKTDSKYVRRFGAGMFFLPIILGVFSAPLIYISLFIFVSPYIAKAINKATSFIQNYRVKKLSAKLKQFQLEHINNEAARLAYIDERIQKTVNEQEAAKIKEEQAKVRKVDPKMVEFEVEEPVKTIEAEVKKEEEKQKEETSVVAKEIKQRKAKIKNIKQQEFTK